MNFKITRANRNKVQKLFKEIAKITFRTDKEVIGISIVLHKSKVERMKPSGIKVNNVDGKTIWRKKK